MTASDDMKRTANRTIILRTVDGAMLFVGEQVFQNIVMEAHASFEASKHKASVDDQVCALALDGCGRIARHFNWVFD